VQKVLGHTDISTTKIYAQVMEKYLMAEMAKFGKI
jgi:site-specific recombinase XerD